MPLRKIYQVSEAVVDAISAGKGARAKRSTEGPLSPTLSCMCIICIDFARGALKLDEARRALGEMRSTLDPKHVREIERQLKKAERNPPPTGTP